MQESFSRTVEFGEATSGANALVQVRVVDRTWAAIRCAHSGEGDVEVLMSHIQLWEVIGACQALRHIEADDT
jgi:hypothetical protein